MPDRFENGAAVFEVPIVNESQALNFIAHNGDLKSPIHDLSIVPQTFGSSVWIVQDEVAALAALNALGDKSAGLDLSMIIANDGDSGLAATWTDSASFIEIYVRGYQDSDGDGGGNLTVEVPALSAVVFYGQP